jgi:hypothetical protein
MVYGPCRIFSVVPLAGNATAVSTVGAAIAISARATRSSPSAR